jgi:hypothetical protein
VTADVALRFADCSAHACSDVLGDTLVGAILHGSLVLGDYTPGRSDASPTPAPPMELYVALDPEDGVKVETRHPGERDLVVELSVCRAHGRSLIGPPAADLIGPVPDAWVDAVGDAQLADWQALPFGGVSIPPPRSTKARSDSCSPRSARASLPRGMVQSPVSDHSQTRPN